MGTWMQNVALSWLVLDLTHSAFKLGLVSALQFAPMLFLSLFTGPFIDYFNKRYLIISTQTILMLQAFVLSILVWTGTVHYWHLIALSTLLGIVNTVDMPARQSFIIELVGREDFMNAIALNSSAFNAARALGPAFAGMLIALVGTAACFLLNGVSFLAVIAGLLLMSPTPSTAQRPPLKSLFGEMHEAISYIENTPSVLLAVSLVAAVSIFGTNFNVLVPVFVRIELHRDAAAFGFLMSSFGGGALFGSLALALLSRRGPKPSYLLGSGMGLSLLLIMIGLQHSYALTALLVGFSGCAMVTFFGMANTTVQLNTTDRLRGRVMSIYTLVFGGLTPFGSLYAGTLSHFVNAPFTFALGGLMCFVAFGIALGRLHRRPSVAESR